MNTIAFAKDVTGIMDKYEAQKIAEHTWGVFGPLTAPNVENKGFMNNPVFIITDNSVVVIDPGSSVHVGRALLKKIRQQTDKPITHIFDSHVHGDHWLGNQAFLEENPDVKIYAHPVMIEEAKDGEGQSWIDLMETLTEGATTGTEATYPTIALENNQEIKIDNITIKAHLNKLAHTKTDAMYQIIEDKVLVTGDNTFSNRMPRLDDGSYVGNMMAMDVGLALDVEVVVPGHGPSGGKEVLSNFREFLYTIYDTSKNLLDEDMEPFEMKPIIVKKLEKYQKWVNFDGAIGKLISVAVLEAENE
jgi:glyoxylase-like metal-dependent hydrolase (beta-lactamase superfamily II)